MPKCIITASEHLSVRRVILTLHFPLTNVLYSRGYLGLL